LSQIWEVFKIIIIAGMHNYDNDLSFKIGRTVKILVIGACVVRIAY
jgi:hypothetical protein